MKHINICELCGKEFNTSNIHKKFCSENCYRQGRTRINNKPTKKELYNLLLNYTTREISKMFSININTVYLWCKYYGLPQTNKEYKKIKDNYKLKPFVLNPLDTSEYVETVDYEFAPVVRITKNNLHIEYVNIYDAANHLINNNHLKSTKESVLRGIKKAVINRKEYLNSKWIIQSIWDLQDEEKERCK